MSSSQFPLAPRVMGIVRIHADLKAKIFPESLTRVAVPLYPGRRCKAQSGRSAPSRRCKPRRARVYLISRSSPLGAPEGPDKVQRSGNMHAQRPSAGSRSSGGHERHDRRRGRLKRRRISRAGVDEEAVGGERGRIARSEGPRDHCCASHPPPRHLAPVTPQTFWWNCLCLNVSHSGGTAFV